MLENNKAEIDWEFNQDISDQTNIMINDKVFHKKFGKGTVASIDSDTADVMFTKYGIKKIYLKFLKPSF